MSTVGPALISSLSGLLVDMSEDNKLRACAAYFGACAVSPPSCGGLVVQDLDVVSPLFSAVGVEARAELMLRFFESCTRSGELAKLGQHDYSAAESAGSITSASISESVSVRSSVSGGRAARRARARRAKRELNAKLRRASSCDSISGSEVSIATVDMSNQMTPKQFKSAACVEHLVTSWGEGYCYLRAVSVPYVDAAARQLGSLPTLLEIAALPSAYFQPAEVLASLHVAIGVGVGHVNPCGLQKGSTRILTLFRSVATPVSGSIAESVIARCGRARAQFVNDGFRVGAEVAVDWGRESVEVSLTALARVQHGADESSSDEMPRLMTAPNGQWRASSSSSSVSWRFPGGTTVSRPSCMRMLDASYSGDLVINVPPGVELGGSRLGAGQVRGRLLHRADASGTAAVHLVTSWCGMVVHPYPGGCDIPVRMDFVSVGSGRDFERGVETYVLTFPASEDHSKSAEGNGMWCVASIPVSPGAGVWVLHSVMGAEKVFVGGAYVAPVQEPYELSDLDRFFGVLGDGRAAGRSIGARWTPAGVCFCVYGAKAEFSLRMSRVADSYLYDMGGPDSDDEIGEHLCWTDWM